MASFRPRRRKPTWRPGPVLTGRALADALWLRVLNAADAAARDPLGSAASLTRALDGVVGAETPSTAPNDILAYRGFRRGFRIYAEQTPHERRASADTMRLLVQAFRDHLKAHGVVNSRHPLAPLADGAPAPAWVDRKDIGGD